MSINRKIGSTIGILTAAGFLLSYAPSVDAANCTAFGTTCGGSLPTSGAKCPAANPKGEAWCLIGQGNPGDPPTNRQLHVDNYVGTIFPIVYTAGWGINSSGGVISGCSATDTGAFQYAKDYYGCNSMVRSKVHVHGF